MMNKMATRHPTQESFLPVITGNTLQFLYFYFQLLALHNIPSGIFAKIARKGSSQKLEQPSMAGQFHPNQTSLIIQFFLVFAILAVLPLFLGRALENE